MSQSWEWIGARAKYSLSEDARQKLWEMKIISLSQQPGKESDARRLSESFRETVEMLEDRITTLEGSKNKNKPNLDGEMIWVG